MGGLWCVNVGHNREEMNQAIQEQLGKLAYFTTFGEVSNEPSAKLATKIKAPAAAGGHGQGVFRAPAARTRWRLR